MARSRGFTLLELVFVLTIVGVLAAIAIPSYRGYVMRSNRAIAAGMLADLAAKQEAFSLRRRSYADSFAPLVGTAGTEVFVNRQGTVAAALTGDSIYQVTLSNIAATTFTFTADAVNDQADDTNCLQFVIAHTGQRSATTTDCWKN